MTSDTDAVYLRDLADRAESAEPARKEPEPAVRKKPAKYTRSKYPREYDAWKVINQRCNGPIESTACKYYRNVGIQISESWTGSNGFATFMRDMGPRPAGCALIRRNKQGHYEPGNCFWGPKSDVRVGVRRDPSTKIPDRVVALDASTTDIRIHMRSNRVHIDNLKPMTANETHNLGIQLILFADSISKVRAKYDAKRKK